MSVIHDLKIQKEAFQGIAMAFGSLDMAGLYACV